MVVLKAATELVREIKVRFERGDAARELVSRLVTQTTIIQRYIARLGNDLPKDVTDQIGKLFTDVKAVVECGDNWLSKAAGPELAAEVVRSRVCRTYGLSTRNN
jgi:hypothetical protein